MATLLHLKKEILLAWDEVDKPEFPSEVTTLSEFLGLSLNVNRRDPLSSSALYLVIR